MSSRLHGRVIRGTFKPHPWFRNAHAQTILTLFRPKPEVKLRIERRELPDGDFVDIGWCEPDHGFINGHSHGPIAILLHGLASGFDAKYARGTAQRLLARGWRPVILQFRGAGPEPNRLPRHYHHGDTEDLRELVQLLRAREPHTPLFAVGWSLGANVLLKYLGEEGERTPVAAAAAVCAPFWLKPCAEKLRTGFSRVYQDHLLRELKDMVRRKHEAVELPIDLANALSARDFIEFDNRVTAILNGFRDAEDYYSRSACGQYLDGIARPTLAIHAKDDPFMVPEIIPAERKLPPSVTIEVCDNGGHVGFIAAGPKLQPQFWAEERVAQFLEAQLRQ
jgi:hypothetical protein